MEAALQVARCRFRFDALHKIRLQSSQTFELIDVPAVSILLPLV